MVDDVWPPDPGDNVSLSSFNGIGFMFKGFTRADSRNRCFATRWFVLLGLPVLPMERCYITVGPLTGYPTGVGATWHTEYHIHGRSRLRIGEVLRTYLFGWLTPPLVAAPTITVLTYANEIAAWFPHPSTQSFPWPLLIIFASLGWPIVGLFLVVKMLAIYQDRWAPVRKPRWR